MINTILPIFTLPLLLTDSQAKCLYRTSHTDGFGTAQSFYSEPLSCPPPYNVARRLKKLIWNMF
nr:MAG TPA: hypothetical protein [Inoviridae sp.]